MASVIEYCDGFDWDEGNSDKNWHLHGVTDHECEEVFANRPIIVAYDQRHSSGEPRHTALGKTDHERHIFVSFTIRRSMVRVISGRAMNNREERRYEEEIKRNS